MDNRIRICLAGDSHSRKDLIQKIIEDNPGCDYYLHTGDSMSDEGDIFPFESVKGNCDGMFDYRSEGLSEHKLVKSLSES